MQAKVDYFEGAGNPAEGQIIAIQISK